MDPITPPVNGLPRRSMTDVVTDVVDIQRRKSATSQKPKSATSKTSRGRRPSILNDTFGDIASRKTSHMTLVKLPNQIFTDFTVEHMEEMKYRLQEDKIRRENNKNRSHEEARLVDGELKYDQDADEPDMEKNFALVEGNVLPLSYTKKFPLDLVGKPIKEIDKSLMESFVIISKRFQKLYINRYSYTKSLFIFSPWNGIRRFALKIATHQLFDYIIILTILTNCVFLTLPENNASAYAEYVFLAIYTLEAIIKITARGLFLNSYTYFRDPWNWLDFIVIASSYLLILLEAMGNSRSLGNITGLRTFRVLRAFKTFSIVPGLKTIIGALLKSLRWLMDVIGLTIFCMIVFSLFTIQVYVGVLRNKCVLNKAFFVSDFEWLSYVKQEKNWYGEPFNYLLCGNVTGAGKCPLNYTCLPNIGENPNFGYTNFDSIGWAMVNVFQLITLDFWEDLYDKIIRADGSWNVVFFIFVVYCASFYLINLMLAVVATAYEEELQIDIKLQELDNLNVESDGEVDNPLNASKNGTLNDSSNKVVIHDKIDIAEIKKGEILQDENRPIHQEVQNVNIGNIENIIKYPNEIKAVEKNLTLLDGNNKTAVNEKPLKGESKDLNKMKPEITQKPEKVDAMSQTIVKTQGISQMASKTHMDEESHNEVVKKDNDDTENQINYKPEMKKLTLYSRIRRLSSDVISRASRSMQSLRRSSKNVGEPSVSSEVSSIFSNESQNENVDCDAPEYMSTEKADQEEKIVDRNCLFCNARVGKLKCYKNFLVFQDFLYNIVGGFLFEMFITACIALNVLAMAMEYHGMNTSFKMFLSYANIMFTSIFIMEAVLKLLALNMKYFSSKWNIFDFVIVIASIIDLALESIDGMSVIRAFRLLRLLRVFKLAQTWNTMRMLLYIIINTLGALGNITIVLLVIIFIFAVVGMQLFKDSYLPHYYVNNKKPAWHFDDFFHSLLLVFRVLCGEWIEPLWDCMRPNGQLCLVVFLPTLVIGNFMVLNLFLALLLNSFASDSLHHGDSNAAEDSQFKKGLSKLKAFFSKNKAKVQPRQSISLILEHLSNERHLGSLRTVTTSRTFSTKSRDEAAVTSDVAPWSKSQVKTVQSAFRKFSAKSNAATEIKHDLKAIARIDENDTLSPTIPLETSSSKAESKPLRRQSLAVSILMEKDKLEQALPPPDPRVLTNCLPPLSLSIRFNSWFDDSNIASKWKNIRHKCHSITEHNLFEYFILIIIFASSISLAFDDIHINDKPTLKYALFILDYIFTAIFVLEMVLKWISLGFYKYFTEFWTILDFFIVLVSLITIATETVDISSLKALRTFRAFRPLRAISRWRGMKIVVNALLFSIPSIINVLLVCFVFWLIFSIAGVQLFGGKFSKCVTADGDRISVNVVQNKTVCLDQKFRWVNSKVNFDNVLNGLLALFQVATFEGWIEIMEDATSANYIDKQPYDEANFHAYWFFMIFIIVGAFFTLNLLVGVIIDNFNCQKKKYDGNYLDVFLTSTQKKYYNTMKRIALKKPEKAIKRPKGSLQNFFYDVTMSIKFELIIVILIIINTIVMTIEHYNQRNSYAIVIEIANILFTTTFLLEAVVKIIGLRWHYFRQGWNIFDFMIVITSIIGVVFQETLNQIFITPTLLRVVRVFRIGRAIRLIKWAKGIRKLMFALILSFPALFNIGCLLMLIVFIYTIFGMTLFGRVKQTFGMNELVNFETFSSSIVLLLRLTTAAGWNEILDPLLITEPDCDPNYWTDGNGKKVKITNGDCGSFYVGIFYMVTFIFFTYLIIINMYIAIILENFTVANEQEEIGITEDDFESFYITWQQFDPYATQYIKYETLFDLVDNLDQPFGIRKPNEIALVALDIPIVGGDRFHCLDVLTALCRHVLGTVENSKELDELKATVEEGYMKVFPDREQQIVVSSTMQRKKEDVAAKTLQRAYRKHKTADLSNLRVITKMAIKNKEHCSSKSNSLSMGTLSGKTSPLTDKKSKNGESNEENPNHV